MMIQIAAQTRSSARRLTCCVASFILFALICSPAAALAAAEDPGTSMFSFSGFGTFGLVHSSEDDADYTGSSLQPNGAGYTRAWSPDVDSRLGVQATAHFAPQFSAMLQVISEQNFDKTFKPHVEWANITYQPTPEFSVRLGRIALPTYLLSDSHKVGYANPWVRPPVDMYSLAPVFNSDGADATYKMHAGDVSNTLVATYGNSRFRVPGGGEFEVKHLWVIADTVEYGSLTLHVAYQQSTYTYGPLNLLFDAFRQFGPQGAALADKYSLDNKVAQLFTAGAIYNPGNWFVTGEWGRRNLHSAVGRSTAWYLSSGYRLAKFTPYLTYAKTKADTDTFDPGLDVAMLPPYLAGPATALNAGLNELMGTTPDQNTISVGSRWDVMENVDLKLQYDHVELKDGSAGTLINVQPGFQRGGSLNLLSVTVDFVW